MIWRPDAKYNRRPSRAHTGWPTTAPVQTRVRTPGRGEVGHVFPSALPDGRAVLFTVLSSWRVADSQIAVIDLATGEQQTLVRGGSQAEYVSSGHLVYAVSGTLRAVRFDADRRRVLGDPVPVAEDVMTL